MMISLAYLIDRGRCQMTTLRIDMTDFVAVALTGFANGLGTFTALEVFSYIKKHDLLVRPSNIFDAMTDIKNKIEKRGKHGQG
jgi:hypothetical protein